jgi:hypothetical protein
MNNELAEVVMVIDGHDIRMAGDGWRWQDGATSWDDLIRVPYTHKTCMTCGFEGPPDAVLRPCHEMWSDRTGHPSASARGGPVYYPPLRGEAG